IEGGDRVAGIEDGSREYSALDGEEEVARGVPRLVPGVVAWREEAPCIVERTPRGESSTRRRGGAEAPRRTPSAPVQRSRAGFQSGTRVARGGNGDRGARR